MGLAQSSSKSSIPTLYSEYVGDFVYWDVQNGRIVSGESKGRRIRVIQQPNNKERIAYAFTGIVGEPPIPDARLSWNTGFVSREGSRWKATLRGLNGSEESWKIDSKRRTLESCYWSKKFWKGTFRASDVDAHFK